MEVVFHSTFQKNQRSHKDKHLFSLKAHIVHHLMFVLGVQIGYHSIFNKFVKAGWHNLKLSVNRILWLNFFSLS